jgi:hypothetical protein
MSTKDTYLAVFLSNKTSPRWRAWYAMSEEAKDVEGLAAGTRAIRTPSSIWAAR